MKALLVSFIFLVCSLHCYAQSGTSLTDNNGDTIEVAVLKRELQVMKDFTEHILSTVYWSLGIVATILMAMIGFGWYQNVRAYQRDKEALLRELSDEINMLVKEASINLKAQSDAKFEAFDESMAKHFATVFKRMNNLRLISCANVFHAAHNRKKTPRTDCHVLLMEIENLLDKVDQGTLDHSLAVVLDHLENGGEVGAKTGWLQFISKLPEACSVTAGRLRDIVNKD